MLQTLTTEKVDEKKWGHLSSFPVSFLWFVNCPKKCIFLQFCAELSKKCKSVKAIYIYVSVSSHYTLSENSMVYMSLNHRSRDIGN